MVGLEVAKLAKEKGFDYPVNYFYWEGILDRGDGDCDDIWLNHNKYDKYISAPTQSLLQKWLREEYGLFTLLRHLPIH